MEYLTAVISGALQRDHCDIFGVDLYKHTVNIYNLHSKICYVTPSIQRNPEDKMLNSMVYVTLQVRDINLPWFNTTISVLRTSSVFPFEKEQFRDISPDSRVLCSLKKTALETNKSHSSYLGKQSQPPRNGLFHKYPLDQQPLHITTTHHSTNISLWGTSL